MPSLPLFVGIKGQVLALDSTTGAEIWRTKLKSTDFVTLASDGGSRVFAATRGEVFCLDGATGAVLWTNRMSGLGWGLVTLLPAGVAGGTDPELVAEARRRLQARQAAAAST
ncbi:MAG: PQQ-binding-like beta-propeller repeat protein [Gemmatimonadales bacterium]